MKNLYDFEMGITGWKAWDDHNTYRGSTREWRTCGAGVRCHPWKTLSCSVSVSHQDGSGLDCKNLLQAAKIDLRLKKLHTSLSCRKAAFLPSMIALQPLPKINKNLVEYWIPSFRGPTGLFDIMGFAFC